MSPTTKKPIDVYCRMSDDAGNDEMGVERQKEEIIASLKARDIPVGEIHIDNDISASRYTKKVRPAFRRMCERIAAGESAGVAAYHWKRLLRRPREMEDFIDLVEGANAKVLTIKSGDLDLTTAAGRAVARIIGALGSMESEEISERMGSRMLQEAKAGTPWRRGPRPFGYNDDWLTLHTGSCQQECYDETGKKTCSGKHPNESKAYQRMFQLTIEGWSLEQIADDLAERGVTNRKGKRFSASDVHSMIKRPRAAGRRMHKGQDVAAGTWKPIVSPATQAAAIAALRQRAPKQFRRTNGKERSTRLLSTIAVCAKCGRALRSTKSGGAPAYRCAPSDAKACGVVIDAALLEKEVEAQFLDQMLDPSTRKALEKLRRQAPDTRALVEEIDQIRLELDDLAADLGSGSITRTEWKLARDGTQTRLDAATKRLNDLGDGPGRLMISPEDTVKTWKKLDPDERRRRMKMWIEVVRVKPRADVKKPVEHGDVRCYWRGCQEEECLEANREYMRAWKNGTLESRDSRDLFNPERVVVEWRL